MTAGYVDGAWTVTSQRVCTACSAAHTYSDVTTPSTYYVYDASGVQSINPVLADCPSTQTSECGDYTYYSAAGMTDSGTTVLTDRTCTDCSTNTCAEGTYCSGGHTPSTIGTLTSTTCTTQTATCPANTYYAVPAATPADRGCNDCSTNTCPDGTYCSTSTTPSTINTPVSEGSCTTQTATCPAGSFYTAAATATADRTCSPCSAGADPAATTTGPTDSSYVCAYVYDPTSDPPCTDPVYPATCLGLGATVSIAALAALSVSSPRRSLHLSAPRHFPLPPV